MAVEAAQRDGGDEGVPWHALREKEVLAKPAFPNLKGNLGQRQGSCSIVIRG